MNQALLKKNFADPDIASKGGLLCSVFYHNIGHPISGAKIIIKEAGTEHIRESLITDHSGKTERVDLNCPPIAYSFDEQQSSKPYREYDIDVTAKGFESVKIKNVQIFPDVTAIQEINLQGIPQMEKEIMIKPHTLWSTYPPKLPEEEVKLIPEECGFLVLDQPVIPEYIVVHDGSPKQHTAKNYWIPFKDYIKNVASCEIYPTWPIAAITANVLAIISLTLNRVFTGWYRQKDKDFTLTSSSGYVKIW